MNSFILFTLLPDLVWLIVSMAIKILYFLIYIILYGIYLVIWCGWFMITSLANLTTLAIDTVVYYIIYVFHFIWSFITSAPFMIHSYMISPVITPIMSFIGGYFIVPILNIIYYFLFYAIIYMIYLYFNNSRFSTQVNTVCDGVISTFEHMIQAILRPKARKEKESDAVLAKVNHSNKFSGLTFIISRVFKSDDIYKKYYDIKWHILRDLDNNITNLQRNILCVSIIAITLLFIIGQNPSFIFLILFVCITSLSIQNQDFRNELLKIVYVDPNIASANSASHKRRREYPPRSYPGPTENVINAINEMENKSDRLLYQVYSRIDSERHGSIIFINVQDNNEQNIRDVMNNIPQRRTQTILRIDLTVDAQCEEWYLLAQQRLDDLRKFDLLTFQKDWTFLGNCNISLDVIGHKLITVSDNFGRYHVFNNNCQDFIQELCIYIGVISTTYTDRLSIFFGLTSLIYLVYASINLIDQTINIQFVDIILSLVIFPSQIVLLNDIIKSLSIIMTKITKMDKILQQLSRRHINEKVFLLETIALLMVKLFIVNLFVTIISDSLLGIITFGVPLAMVTVIKDFYFSQ